MKKLYFLLVALFTAFAANAAYVNVVGEFNGWADNGISSDADGLAVHEHLQIGTSGFKVKVWDGHDEWLSTGGAIPANTWVHIAGNNDSNMTIAGATADEYFTVEFNVNTSELRVIPETLDYTEWTVAVAGEFNGWSTTDNSGNCDATGLVKFSSLALGSEGFKVIVNGDWRGHASAIDIDSWVELDAGAGNIMVRGASADAVFDLECNVATNSIYLTLVSGTVNPDAEEPVDFSGWYLNVLYANNYNQDNGVAFSDSGSATNGNCFIGCNGFKLKIWNGSENVMLSTGSAIAVGEEIEVTDNSDSDMTVAGASAGDVFNVSYDAVSHKMKVEKAATLTPSSFVIRGSILPAYDGGAWVDEAMASSGDSYTYSGSVKPGQFGVAEMFDWNDGNVQGDWFSSATDGAVDAPGTYDLVSNGNNFTSTLEGDYNFTVNPSTRKLVITAVTTGIDVIGADGSDEAVYYNLQGIKVDAPKAGQIYIRRTSAGAAKVLM